MIKTESQLQSEIIKWLKKQGCYVVKTTPSAGTPAGCPDILFFYKTFYGALEVKKRPNSCFQPLQKQTIKKFSEWNFGEVIHNENFTEIQLKILDRISKI